jgi:hypothetical protein
LGVGHLVVLGVVMLVLVVVMVMRMVVEKDELLLVLLSTKCGERTAGAGAAGHRELASWLCWC